MLEPYEGKLSCTVLRGGSGSNAADLLDDLNGPWLMYDNKKDPYQINNLILQIGNDGVKAELKEKLKGELQKANDEFLPEQDYLERFGVYITKGGYPPFSMEFEPNK